MEEMNRTHKEPAWGWIGALLTAAPRAARPVARPAVVDRAPRHVVTPWSPRATPGWSA